MSHPINSVVEDGLPVDKDEFRLFSEERIALVLTSAAEIEGLELPNTDYVIAEGLVYKYDSEDDSSAHDGVLVLVDETGRRYKVVYPLGLNLADPGSGDRLLIWDDSESLWVPATLNPGLEISGTTIRKEETWMIAASDETTNLTTGTSKASFRMPYDFTITAQGASVKTAPTGSTILVDINDDGATIFSTRISIDASEKSSTTAATPAARSSSTIAADSEITIDIDQVGSSTPGVGLKVWLRGYRT